MRITWILGAFVLCAISMSACSNSGGGGSGGANPAQEHSQMLARLGLETDLPQNPVDRNGAAITVNPLGKDSNVVVPVYEIFRMSTGSSAVVDHDKRTDTYQNLLSLGGDLAWMKNAVRKNCIGADLDGDGIDEIVIAYVLKNQEDQTQGTLMLRVISPKQETGGWTYTEYVKDIAGGVSTGMFMTDTITVLPFLPSLAKGDIDGDDQDEIIVGDFSLYVVDFPTKDFSRPTVKSEGFSSPIFRAGLFVACGDVDGDGIADIAVTNAGNCSLLGLSKNGELVAKPGWNDRAVAPDPSFPYFSANNVAIGDIDFDGKNEVVFHGRVQDLGAIKNHFVVSAMKLNEASSDFEWMGLFIDTYFEDGDSKPLGSNYYSDLALLDYDGDRKIEIFARDSFYRFRAGAQEKYVKGADKLGSNRVFDGNPPPIVRGGDVDGDSRQDLVFCYGAWPYSDGNQQGVGVAGFDSTNTLVVKKTWNEPAGSMWPVVGLANIDHDSPVLRYTGEHELLFSKPVILAALACPPYWKGIQQPPDGYMNTTFGKTTGQSVETEESHGFSVGFSVGYEFQDEFTQSGFAAKVTDQMSFSWQWREIKETKMCMAYSGGKEDKVVFTAVPFDVYYYEVVDTGGADDVTKGARLTISVPRPPQTLAVPRDFYNKNNGDYPDVDESVFTHQIGDPRSYPTTPGVSGVKSGEIDAGVGDSSNAQSIEVCKNSGSGTRKDIEVKVDIEGRVLGATFGASGAYGYGFTYDVTNINCTSYSGAVNNILPEYDYAKYGFKWGLCSYEDSLGGQQFTVVNYWVN